MRTAARGSNLRTLLAEDEAIRESVLEMVTVIETIDQEDTRGFRRANMLDSSLPDFILTSKAKPFRLREHEHNLLCQVIGRRTPLPEETLVPHECLSVNEVSLRGVCYGTSLSSKFRDSTVMFQPSPCDELSVERPLAAGIVQTIFQHTYKSSHPDQPAVTGVYAIVQEHPRMDQNDDPYPEFGFAGGFLCKDEATELHVIELPQIVSHFALTRLLDEGYFHAMPLDRVRLSFFRLEKIILNFPPAHVVVPVG